MNLKFWEKKKKAMTQEEFIAMRKRQYVSSLVILKISERMRGRPERMKADRKRRFRMARKAKMLVKHKDMGLVDDEKFGEKPQQMTLRNAFAGHVCSERVYEAQA